MKDNRQNIADLIGALAEDIEEIKKKLDAQDSPDKDGAVKRLTVKLEPVIRFFNGSTPENISGIFGSGKTIAAYKKSLGGQMVASMQEYNNAIDKDMRERGIPSVNDLLHKILEMQTSILENGGRTLGKARHKQGFVRKFLTAIRSGRALKAIRQLWNKIPDGWYRNPYTWAGIGCTSVFLVLFAVSWVQWREYREGNRRLRTVADKHRVTLVMIGTLYPELSVTVGAYEKLVDVVGVDSTLVVFYKQVERMRSKEKTDSIEE